jgi:hypothetical protein
MESALTAGRDSDPPLLPEDFLSSLAALHISSARQVSFSASACGDGPRAVLTRGWAAGAGAESSVASLVRHVVVTPLEIAAAAVAEGGGSGGRWGAPCAAAISEAVDAALAREAAAEGAAARAVSRQAIREQRAAAREARREELAAAAAAATSAAEAASAANESPDVVKAADSEATARRRELAAFEEEASEDASADAEEAAVDEPPVVAGANRQGEPGYLQRPPYAAFTALSLHEREVTLAVALCLLLDAQRHTQQLNSKDRALSVNGTVDAPGSGSGSGPTTPAPAARGAAATAAAAAAAAAAGVYVGLSALEIARALEPAAAEATATLQGSLRTPVGRPAVVANPTAGCGPLAVAVRLRALAAVGIAEPSYPYSADPLDMHTQYRMSAAALAAFNALHSKLPRGIGADTDDSKRAVLPSAATMPDTLTRLLHTFTPAEAEANEKQIPQSKQQQGNSIWQAMPLKAAKPWRLTR